MEEEEDELIEGLSDEEMGFSDDEDFKDAFVDEDDDDDDEEVDFDEDDDDDDEVDFDEEGVAFSDDSGWWNLLLICNNIIWYIQYNNNCIIFQVNVHVYITYLFRWCCPVNCVAWSNKKPQT